jgi:uncharacterized membrane protein YebE (DUF533 family)
MFDAKALLNSLLGAKGADAVTDALEKARVAAAAAADRAEAGLQGTKAGEAFGEARRYASEHPGRTLAGAGALTALLFGTRAGRRVGGSALQAGGIAAVGGLAYKAYTNWQGSKPLMDGVPGLHDLTAPPASGFTPEEQSEEGVRTILLAMIATAAADGVVDPAERDRITGELRKSGLETEAAGFLDAALANPATPAQIAARVSGEPKLAAQVYTAASLVAAPGNAPAHDYLGRLATALGLSPDLMAHLEAAAQAA